MKFRLSDGQLSNSGYGWALKYDIVFGDFETVERWGAKVERLEGDDLPTFAKKSEVWYANTSSPTMWLSILCREGFTDTSCPEGVLQGGDRPGVSLRIDRQSMNKLVDLHSIGNAPNALEVLLLSLDGPLEGDSKEKFGNLIKIDAYTLYYLPVNRDNETTTRQIFSGDYSKIIVNILLAICIILIVIALEVKPLF